MSSSEINQVLANSLSTGEFLLLSCRPASDQLTRTRVICLIPGLGLCVGNVMLIIPQQTRTCEMPPNNNSHRLPRATLYAA